MLSSNDIKHVAREMQHPSARWKIASRFLEGRKKRKKRWKGPKMKTEKKFTFWCLRCLKSLHLMWQKSHKHSLDGSWQHKKAGCPPFFPRPPNGLELYRNILIILSEATTPLLPRGLWVFSKSNKSSPPANIVVERTFNQAFIHWEPKWGVIFIYLLPVRKVLGRYEAGSFVLYWNRWDTVRIYSRCAVNQFFFFFYLFFITETVVSFIWNLGSVIKANQFIKCNLLNTRI